MSFHLQHAPHPAIAHTYAVDIRVPPGFPLQLATVREAGGRIPADYHKLDGNFLCLGAPTELRLRLHVAPTLITFIDGFIIPYLFGYSHLVKYGCMPFDELRHGVSGIQQHLAELFHTNQRTGLERFLLFAGMKRRQANKHACPCESGRRLGKCHHRRVNELRDRLSRRWFREEYARLAEYLKAIASASPTAKLSDAAAQVAQDYRHVFPRRTRRAKA